MNIIYALPQTINISSLVNRAKCILQQLQFDKKETPWFHDNLLPFLDRMGSMTPQSGFHDLFLKCLIYKKLFSLVDERSYSLFTQSNKILFELLFNPALEEQLLIFLKKKNLNELMEGFSTSAIPLKEEALSDKLDSIWKTTADFAKIVKAIIHYIRWYDRSFNPIKTLITLKEELPSSTQFFQKLDVSDFDVKIDQGLSITLNNGIFLGTTGLFPCIGILAIIEKNNKVPKGLLFHSYIEHAQCIENIYNQYSEKGAMVSFYLFGGLPYLFHEYLNIIYQEKYPIKDIHLGIPTYSSMDCVCYAENNTIYITSLIEDSMPGFVASPKPGSPGFFDRKSPEPKGEYKEEPSIGQSPKKN